MWSGYWENRPQWHQYIFFTKHESFYVQPPKNMHFRALFLFPAKFTSIYFIRVISKYPHDSNTRHRRSRQRLRLDLATFIAFKTNEQYFGHIHDIFCLNVSKFGICVHYGMASNVAEIFCETKISTCFTKCPRVHCGMASNVVEQRF